MSTYIAIRELAAEAPCPCPPTDAQDRHIHLTRLIANIDTKKEILAITILES